jgi:hypothetical protein
MRFAACGMACRGFFVSAAAMTMAWIPPYAYSAELNVDQKPRNRPSDPG